MSHISALERGDSESFECDYVVVGSGAGGATAAEALASAGAQVVLVEAGPWRDPEHYPSTAYGGMRDLMDDWGALITRGRAFWPVVQARAVGGTTVINSAIMVHTPDDIFDLWKREHGVGGDTFRTELLTFQRQLETELEVEVAPEASWGRHNTLAKSAGDKLGIENHYMHRYVKGCIGSGQCMSGCKANKKKSLNLNFVPRVLELGGTVLSNAPVKRVLLKGNRAVGVTGHFVTVKGKKKAGKFTVMAKKAVVVAASATHSPALLLRSKVKSKALGSYFRAHPGTGVFGLFDDAVDMNIGNTQGWASMHYRDSGPFKLETLAIPPEMVMTRIKGGGKKYMERLAEYRHLTMWVHALRAESVGTVRNGWFDKPVVSYSLNKKDMLGFRKGMATVARLQFAAGAKAVMPGIYGLPYQIGPDEVGLIDDGPLDPRNYLAILSHLFGGCVMGGDPTRAVCDERGKVYGYEGLVIADASMIPTVIGVNPQHTIMSLARWVCAHLEG